MQGCLKPKLGLKLGLRSSSKFNPCSILVFLNKMRMVLSVSTMIKWVNLIDTAAGSERGKLFEAMELLQAYKLASIPYPSMQV